MSIQAVAWALDQKLPARPKLVLVSIANHANHVDGYCWLKVETIGAEASCSPRAVHNFIGALIRNGFIRKAQRRGDDGKQRANDYWILLDRDPDLKWIDEAKNEAEEPNADMPPEHVDGMHGVHPAETSREAVEKPACAVGPSAPACSHIDSAEPSKTNPEEGERAKTPYRPRAYAPPPVPRPPAQGEVISAKPTDPIFVFVGTPAYDAWAKVMAIKNRISRWHLVTTRYVNGERQTGWWFPTLFPPAHADPPMETEKAS